MARVWEKRETGSLGEKNNVHFTTNIVHYVPYTIYDMASLRLSDRFKTKRKRNRLTQT